MARDIAARYGLPADDMARRMTAGRFRVKANIDRQTAERLVEDLEALGAMCMIADDSGQIVSRQARPAPAPPSGLAAATMDHAQQDLGALSSGSFTLATLDGEEDRPVVEERMAAAYTPSDFAPPDEVEPQELELAVARDRPAVTRPAPPAPTPPATRQTTSPPAMPHAAELIMPPVPPHAGAALAAAAAVPSVHHTAPSAPSVATAPAQVAVAPGSAGLFERARGALADSARMRFAVGVFAALLIGFLPAHLFALVREGSAMDAIDDRVRAEQAQVTSIEDWDALDDFRAAQLERKQSARTSIALSSLLLWAAAGGGLAYLWFRRLDWDAYRGPG